MNALLIIHTNPESLPIGAKLLAVAVANSEPSEHHHASEPPPYDTIEEIHLHAETVTPLLQEILDFRPPAHWGIND